MSPQQVAAVPAAGEQPSLPPRALEVKTLELWLASLETTLAWYVELYGVTVTEQLLQRAVGYRLDPQQGELSPALQMLGRELRQ